jgi:hypothetical protein
VIRLRTATIPTDEQSRSSQKSWDQATNQIFDRFGLVQFRETAQNAVSVCRLYDGRIGKLPVVDD